jgi:hypothetical protein
MKSKTTAQPTRPAPVAARVESEASVSLGLAVIVYFGLSLLYFLPAFLPDRHIFGTDYFAGSYFVYHFLSERLSAGELPKWLPHVYGGRPVFANPGSTFYPVHLIGDLLLPISRVLPFVFFVQFGLAGVGMFLLARELRCRSWVALVAGVAFQFTGITLSWVYAGHDGRIIVVTLAPLFLYFLHRGVRTAALPWFVGAAATLAFALLSFQIQNAYYLLLAGAIWAVFLIVHHEVYRTAGRGARVVGMGLGSVALAFVLASVNFLPFTGYVPHSPRGMEGGRGYEFSVSFSMPPSDLVALAVPEQPGSSVADPMTGQAMFPRYQGPNPMKLHTEYVGAFVLVLLALGFAYSRRDRYWQFFAGLAVFAFTLSLGGHTPLYRLYYAVLPGLNRFRAPDLAYYVAAIALIVMAALTLEALARLREESTAARRKPDGDATTAQRVLIVGGTVAALAVLGALATATEPMMPGEPARSWGWWRFAIFAGLIAAALWGWMRERIGTRLVLVVLVVLTVADLWVIGRRFFHTVPPAEQTFAADDVVRFLLLQPQPVRLWAFPYPQAYRNGGNYPMLFGINQTGGEDGNQLQRYNEYLGAGVDTYVDWHNFITDAGVVETAEGQAIAFRSQPGFIEGSGTRYVVSMAPLAHPSLREVHRGSALVYEFVDALPRAFLAAEVTTVAEGGALAAMRQGQWNPLERAFVEAAQPIRVGDGPLDGHAEIVSYEPDRVVVRTRANRAALLVLADNMYEGWQAQIGGQSAEVLRTNHTFRGVVVPAGEQTVEFLFRPQPLYVGFWIYVLGFGAIAVYAAFLTVTARRGASPAGPSET